MEHDWFYAEGGRSDGPLSSDALIGVLRRKAAPGTTLVWRAGFETWRPARDVPELAGLIGKPIADAIAAPDPALDRWVIFDSEDAAYDHVPASFNRRRLTIVVAAIALAVAIAGGVMLLPRVLRTSGEAEVRVALPGATARPQPAKPDPAVILAQLNEKAAQAAAATDAVALKLWTAIEPSTMQSPPNLATASRADLENYLRDAQTAEANAAAARQQYAALLDAERGLIEEAARSSGLDESSWSDLLASVDQRHNASLELVSRMLLARQDLYRALQAANSIVIGEFGKYKVDATGQVRFSNKTVIARAIAATERVSAANEALDRIEAEMVQARQSPKQAPEPAWKDMVIKGQAGTGAVPIAPDTAARASPQRP